MEKIFKQIVAYYNAFNSAKTNGDLKTQDFLENKLEELLKDLVCCFETEEMYNYETDLKYYGIYKGAGDEDRVCDILKDVKKLMESD